MVFDNTLGISISYLHNEHKAKHRMFKNKETTTLHIIQQGIIQESSRLQAIRMVMTTLGIIMLGVWMNACASSSNNKKPKTPTVANPVDECLGGGLLDNNVNDDLDSADDYAPFVIRQGNDELLYFTSSRPIDNKNPTNLPAELMVSRRPFVQKQSGTLGKTALANKGWSKAERVDSNSALSKWSRGTIAIGGNSIVVASERNLSSGFKANDKGSSYQFDLYQLSDLKGSDPKPLTNVNDPNWWDSQPTLSPDGNVLIFVSNRPIQSATSNEATSSDLQQGNLHLWYSRRDSKGNFTYAKPLEKTLTNGNQRSPHWGANGKLYYASDWDKSANKTSENGYDIFQSDIYYQQGVFEIGTPTNVNDQSMTSCNTTNVTRINTSANESFPFVSSDGKHLYYSSDRRGGYGHLDIYACPIPAPCIRLVVSMYEREVDSLGAVLKPYTLAKRSLQLQPDNRLFSTSDTIILESNTAYTIPVMVANDACAIRECDVKEIKLTTPANDTLIQRVIKCTLRQSAQKAIVFSDALGTPYFITGYWYPNTKKNYDDFKSKKERGEITKERTQFVDDSDFDYAGATSVVDAFFEQNVFRVLDSKLDSLRNCGDTLGLVISVHGYTDPCRVRQGYYDGDEVEVNSLIIPKGHSMQTSTLQNKAGKTIQLKEGGQQGNMVLAMLRAYHTGQTINQGMRSRSNNSLYTKLLSSGYIRYQAEGFGIYDRARQCEIAKDALTGDLPNKPLVPEDCNKPHSRRIYMYFDVVNKEQLSAGFKRNECGELDAKYLMELKRLEQEKQKRKTEIANEVDSLPTDNESVTPPKPKTSSGEPTDVVFGPYDSEDDAQATVNVLTAMGINEKFRVVKVNSNAGKTQVAQWSVIARYPKKEDAENVLHDFKLKSRLLQTMLKTTTTR